MTGFSASSAFARIGANAAERSLSAAIEGTLVFMRVSASNVYCQNLLDMVYCSLEALHVKLVRNNPTQRSSVLTGGVFASSRVLFRSNRVYFEVADFRRSEQPPPPPRGRSLAHSTVMLLARLRGWSMLVPRSTAKWSAISCTGTGSAAKDGGEPRLQHLRLHRELHLTHRLRLQQFGRGAASDAAAPTGERARRGGLHFRARDRRRATGCSRKNGWLAPD